MSRRRNRGGWAGRAIRAAAAAAALLLAAGAARAQSCTFQTVSGVSFGSYDALDTSPLDQTGGLSIRCSGLGLFQEVTVDLSAGSSGDYSAREMRNGASSLQYNLYLDAGRLFVWGDGTAGTSRFGPLVPVFGIVDATMTIFGRIPARQASPVGIYTDTVTVTINF